MPSAPRLPRLARWLLRHAPVPTAARGVVEADLSELFEARRHERGTWHARLRLYRDVASLWLRPRRVSPAGAGRAGTLFGGVAGDLAYASRLFRRQPVILALTVAGLSLGLGVATAAFSLVNAAVLRSDGLVDSSRAPGVLKTTAQSVATSWTYDEFRHLQRGATHMSVDAVLSSTPRVGTSATEVEAPRGVIAFVSGGFFATTGGTMMAGRPLVAADETGARAGPPPAVVSHRFWTSRLNQDPDAVGRMLRVGRTTVTVVGVAARGFSVPRSVLLWLPMTAYAEVYDAGPAAGQGPDVLVDVFGRLLPGAEMAEAEAQLGGVAASLPATGPDQTSLFRVRLDPRVGLGREGTTAALAITAMLFAGISLVVLLACANVASVLIATAIAREREMGVRAALGASRWRIVRQLVTEGLALGVVSAPIGLLLAWAAMPAIAQMIQASPGADLAPDFNVYLFLAAVTIATGVGAGLAPAWHGRRCDLASPLKGDGARDGRIGPRRLRFLLVSTQAAASVLLIVLAALFVRATLRAATIDVGFDPAGLYEVALDGSDDDVARARDTRDRALAEIRAVPGVTAATLAELTPFGAGIKTAIARDVPGRVVHLNRTRPDFFAAIGLRLLAGRTFTQDEIVAGAPVAVVSESVARAYWPAGSPIGQPLPEVIPGDGPRPLVVGVIEDAITARVFERSPFAVYEPLDAAGDRYARLLVRIADDAPGVLDQVNRRLRAIDPEADVRVHSVDARLAQALGQPQRLAALTGVVGLVAMALCVIGLYGLTASVVGQRTREMGVRVAMGADRRDLLRLLMRDSLRPVVAGLAVGAGAALLAGRLVTATAFFGVPAQDPLAFAGAAGVLLAATAIAVLLPARRAARVDAAGVLRRS